MDRSIRLPGILSLPLLSGSSAASPEIPEAERIPNGPAPAPWTPAGAGSDGINFRITLNGEGKLARF